jgi:sialate O-acetylesterase
MSIRIARAEVGERLALWALGAIYREPIVFSGPLYDSMAIEGAKIRIRFTHTGSGLVARGALLQGFSIAGSDRKFYWASAAIG